MFDHSPISSMKMIEGWRCLAAVKRLLTSFSPSPTYLLVRELALMLKNALSDSLATARASIVFPLPGGPNSSNPRVGVLRPVNSSGLEQNNESEVRKEEQIPIYLKADCKKRKIFSSYISYTS